MVNFFYIVLNNRYCNNLEQIESGCRNPVYQIEEIETEELIMEKWSGKFVKKIIFRCKLCLPPNTVLNKEIQVCIYIYIAS